MTYPLTWTLTDLGPIPGTEPFRQWLKSMETGFADSADKTAQQLASSEPLTASQLRTLIDLYADSRAEWHQAMSLVECYIAEQAAEPAYRIAHGQLSALQPKWERAEHLLDQLITKIPPAELNEWLSGSQLDDVAQFVKRRQQAAALQLPDPLADFAAEMNVNGQHAWSRLYDLLSGEVRIKVMERGQVVEKSPGQIAFDSPERSVRQNNYFASQTAWQQIAEPAAAALNHLVGSRLTQDKWAKRSGHLATPLLQNRVTEAAVGAMWDAISDCKADMVAFLQAKQKLLGVPELCWYDLDAPLATNSEPVDYQTGCDIILTAFEQFHPPLFEFAKMSLSDGWVEAEDRPGKRQGGFCIDFPNSSATRIFMTYRDSEDSLSTLAHELGHAYHGWVLRNQPYVSQSYPMTLAETASTFAETIVAEQRLQTAVDAENQRAVLGRLLGDAVTFMMNIHSRWLFDNALHTRRADGELSADELSELMVECQQTGYANAIAAGNCNPTFWISKLHFYISDEPFYNFPYTFGYLLSQRLYLEAKTDPANFPSRYDQFLLNTTNASALTAARDAFGFDFESTAFWSEALQPIRDRVAAFLKLSDSQ